MLRKLGIFLFFSPFTKGGYSCSLKEWRRNSRLKLIEIVILGVVFAFEMGQRKKDDAPNKNAPIIINNYIDPGHHEH